MEDRDMPLLQRYDMPAMFGASLLPDQSIVYNTTVAAISFETEIAAAAFLLPRFFRLTEVPVVTLTYINYPSLEYLGGRGYKELVVAVSAIYANDDGDIKAGFAPVMWVDQVGALISGREYMGFGKLLGNFQVERGDGHLLFRCSEYDSVLVEGETSQLTAITEDRLQRINIGAAEVKSFGWKYIASNEDVPDADYPLVNVTRWKYHRAWSGAGRLKFHDVSDRDAPMSSRVIAELSRLPIRGQSRAFVAEGDVVIDRTATRRLSIGAMTR
jgi:acetoacetate decarboxylase